MSIKFFRGIGGRHPQELAQLKENAELLNSHDPSEKFYLLTNFMLNNVEIDCLLLRREGPVILELKSFSGEIYGNENQYDPWTVKTQKDGVIPLTSNLYKQLFKQ